MSDNWSQPVICVLVATYGGLWSGPHEDGWLVTSTPGSRTHPTSPDYG